MQEFKYAFQINRLTLFFVEYYTLGNNSNPHFATSAMHYVRSKQTIDRGGQCQEDVLSGQAMTFWRKWDWLHLKDLTYEQYNEIRYDIERLKLRYNYFEELCDTFRGRASNTFTRSENKRLSMMPLKRACEGSVDTLARLTYVET